MSNPQYSKYIQNGNWQFPSKDSDEYESFRTNYIEAYRTKDYSLFFYQLFVAYLVNPGRPVNRLLVETDSPFLAPIPLRGKSNEPSYIIHTLEKLALIKKISTLEIEKNTTSNFFKLFNLNQYEY